MRRAPGARRHAWAAISVPLLPPRMPLWLELVRMRADVLRCTLRDRAGGSGGVPDTSSPSDAAES